MNQQRVFKLNNASTAPGPVVYWMSRDQRAADNWALLFAQTRARETKQPLAVVFCLAPEFLGATLRHYDFMLKGLQETADELDAKHIAFFLLQGSPDAQIPRLLAKLKAGCLVTDFDPLRVKRRWKAALLRRIGIGCYEVDAHNIVPCRLASSKQEFGAYTIRPKIWRLTPEFWEEFPQLKKHPFGVSLKPAQIPWDNILRSLPVDRSVAPVSGLRPGAKAAAQKLSGFIRKGLATYPQARNDPNLQGQSGLSAYLHFGQISAQRVAREVRRARAPEEAKEVFLEELIIRQALSDNFCFYNDDYDTSRGFPLWAKRTLLAHRRDHREYLYTQEQFDQARTHDPLWNACQRQMRLTGKMHGYLRMYWAKKILEWTRSAEQAQRIAIYLNDRYELDGRDPNGYAGIAWSIGGVHDRAWGERAVLGKIRYMSYNGCKAKFDVKLFTGCPGLPVDNCGARAGGGYGNANR
ncbi:MAG TPA: deoxyribodipyrimidine photo-lyase [Candidatus Omnitrophota bacterium]|nr:deoxyribodipyrimidine photo-lyase [Candidatus Omnitrophota bacterium]HRZ14402.1 deoxyribodipyrimidine photo-lyase [Candidatus Omnitrophota bacterium]